MLLSLRLEHTTCNDSANYLKLPNLLSRLSSPPSSSSSASAYFFSFVCVELFSCRHRVMCCGIHSRETSAPPVDQRKQRLHRCRYTHRSSPAKNMQPYHWQLAQQRRRPLHALARPSSAMPASARHAAPQPVIEAENKIRVGEKKGEDATGARVGAAWKDSDGGLAAGCTADANRTPVCASPSPPPPRPSRQFNADGCRGAAVWPKRTREDEAAARNTDCRGVAYGVSSTSLFPVQRRVCIAPYSASQRTAVCAARCVGAQSSVRYTGPLRSCAATDDDDAATEDGADEASLLYASSPESSAGREEEGGDMSKQLRSLAAPHAGRGMPVVPPPLRVPSPSARPVRPLTWSPPHRRHHHHDTSRLMRDVAAIAPSLCPARCRLFFNASATIGRANGVMKTGKGIEGLSRSCRENVMELMEYTRLVDGESSGCVEMRRQALAEALCTSVAFYAAHID